MYCINDFNPRDKASYFNGTDVVVANEVGHITDTNGDAGLFQPVASTSNHVIDLKDIQWDGRYPSRLIHRINNRNQLVLAGMLGSRTYKKGVVRRNFSFVKVQIPSSRRNNTPHRVYTELPTRPSASSTDHVYNAYLNSLSEYYSYEEDIKATCVNARVMLLEFRKKFARFGRDGVVYVSGDYFVGLAWDDGVNQFIVKQVVMTGRALTDLRKLYKLMYGDKKDG